MTKRIPLTIDTKEVELQSCPWQGCYQQFFVRNFESNFKSKLSANT